MLGSWAPVDVINKRIQRYPEDKRVYCSPYFVFDVHCGIGGINNRAMLGNRGFHAVDSGFPVLDTGFFELYSGFQNRGFWIPHVSI